MKEFAAAEWQRARRTLGSGQQLISSDPDSAASRAYYAAFHAVTCLFALRGQSFSMHSAVRAALHRELIRSGEWPAELGQAYDLLLDLRETADYGGMSRVSAADARNAVQKAAAILDAVRRAHPELPQGDE